MLYNITNFFDRILSYIYTRRLFGPRCPEVNTECACCQAWITHDELFS